MCADVRDATSVYLNALARVPDSLRLSFENLKALGPLPIEGKEITASILRTLKIYYEVGDEVKVFLNKRQRAVTADFFVETLLFYLKAFIETHKLGVVASSERKIEPRRGSLRPDISVWKGEDLVAVIECKTNLGWNRKGWKSDFLKREAEIHSDFPDAKCFLIVLTATNWPGFGKDPKVGDQYFTLSKDWPSHIDLEHAEASIENPIEPLLRHIKEVAQRKR